MEYLNYALSKFRKMRRGEVKVNGECLRKEVSRKSKKKENKLMLA